MESASFDRLPILLASYLAQYATVELISSSNIGMLFVLVVLQLGCIQSINKTSSEFIVACQ